MVHVVKNDIREFCTVLYLVIMVITFIASLISLVELVPYQVQLLRFQERGTATVLTSAQSLIRHPGHIRYNITFAD